MLLAFLLIFLPQFAPAFSPCKTEKARHSRSADRKQIDKIREVLLHQQVILTELLQERLTAPVSPVSSPLVPTAPVQARTCDLRGDVLSIVDSEEAHEQAIAFPSYDADSNSAQLFFIGRAYAPDTAGYCSFAAYSTVAL
ncbi:hypothetical protein EOD39_10109 [Acipenser ruthenus]|uniref:Uncharacterized protein n=1 Tax=Acipenser ruthenus TaxID=7906 RepID=A0A444TYG0_ACIRT|nr:hypothetical protein EOD39_10109 [Acipenser ruthenus]